MSRKLYVFYEDVTCMFIGYIISSIIIFADKKNYIGDAYKALKDFKGKLEKIELLKLTKKVLIVDDINDTGRTINHLKDNVWLDADEHFDLFGYKDEEEFLKQKKYDLKFAVLVHNEASDADVNYSAKHINKMEEKEWIVFPWENWWETLPK